MSNLARRKTVQTHPPIGRVGTNCPGQSEASAQDSSHEETNQVAFTKRPWRASQLIGIEEFTRSDGQNQRFHKIRWSESKIPEDQMVRIGDSRRSDGQNHILQRIDKIGWSESYRPIRTFGRLFNRYKWSLFPT